MKRRSDKPFSSPLPTVEATKAVSWFPPHMHRAEQNMAKTIGKVHLVLEVRDARLPLLSSNPRLLTLVNNRPRLLLLNKADLADPLGISAWQDYFKAQGEKVLWIEAQAQHGLQEVVREGEQLIQQSFSKRRLLHSMAPRCMVVGIPNVGKSTLINRLLGRKILQVAPRPGVTKGLSWWHAEGSFQLMDTPGIILPRLEDRKTILYLGWSGALREQTLEPVELASSLLEHLLPRYAPGVHAAFGQPFPPALKGDERIAWVAETKHFVRQGGTTDLSRAAHYILKAFQAGKFGQISLEWPLGTP